MTGSAVHRQAAETVRPEQGQALLPAELEHLGGGASAHRLHHNPAPATVARDRAARGAVWVSGEGGIRTPDGPKGPYRFSRPAHSTALPPLRWGRPKGSRSSAGGLARNAPRRPHAAPRRRPPPPGCWEPP